MPNNEMDYSLIHRTPDGNGKILVTTPGSPDKGSWETEAELKTYVNASVNVAINALNTRVTNIEETLMGENEVTVSYPDDGNYTSLMPNKVPARSLKFAEVPTIRGKSRAWNQQCHPVILDWWYTEFGATVSYSDGVATLTPHAQYGRLSQDYPYIANHVLLISVKIKLSNANNGNFVSVGMYGFSSSIDGSFDCKATTDWQTVTFLGSTNTASSANRLCVTDARTSDWGTIQIKDFICRDLTLIFPEGVPSTIAECVQKCPDLLKYDAYDAGSLVDTIVTGVEAIGRNLIDWSAITADAFVRSADGEVQSYGSGDVNATDFIPVVGGSSYFLGGFTSPNYGNSGAIYDINKNFIGTINHYTYLQPITIPANGAYIRISLWLANFSDAENSAYLTLNSNPHAFTPYKTDTISLPETVTLKSAGSVSEVLTLETGKKTRPIGRVDLGTLNWSYYSSGGITHFYSDTLTDIKRGSNNDYVMNAITPLYQCVSINVMNTETIPKTIAISSDGFLCIDDDAYTDAPTFKTAMSGVYLNYELATPLSDEQVCDPVPNNFLEVEGGGTVETIQTQTPVIDNCLDVTYDIIPA